MGGKMSRNYNDSYERLNILKEFIEAVQSTSGRNEKINILTSAKEMLEREGVHFILEETLKFLFDPMVVTGISTAKLSKDIEPSGNISENLLELLSYLRVNKTGRDVDIAVVKEFLASNPLHADWVGQLVTKSLKLGIDVSTINKVYGKNFIKVFEVMLAESFADNPDYLDGKEFIITQKLDGLRCVAFVYNNDEVKFFTRNGQDYGDVPDVAADLLKLPARDVAYDGELIAKSNSKDVGEVFRETSSVARTDGTKKGLIYHVFDRVPLEDFLNGFSPIPCIDRKLDLNSCIVSKQLEWVSQVEILYAGNDQNQITEFMKMSDANGWEGLMLNIYDAPYRSKRVRDLLKVKKFRTIDVRVTGVYEGEGNFVGTLGGIECEFEVGGVTNKTRCGSGFTLEQRNTYWNNPDMLIGKIVELKCFEISQNRDGTKSLRFPVWLDIIRFDKDSTSVV